MTSGARGRWGELLLEQVGALWAECAAHPSVRRAPVLDEPTASRLLAYLDILLMWRVKTSLVATAAPEEIVARHIVDSLAVLPFLGPGEKVADLGSGAGLPGLILAIVAADLDVVLVEPRRKRASFLLAAVRATEATNCRVVPQRAEEVEASVAAAIDVVVSRAFGPLAEFLTAAAAMIPPARREQVRVIVMKGPKGPEEAAAMKSTAGPAVSVDYHLADRTPRVLLVYPSLPSSPRA